MLFSNPGEKILKSRQTTRQISPQFSTRIRTFFLGLKNNNKLKCLFNSFPTTHKPHLKYVVYCPLKTEHIRGHFWVRAGLGCEGLMACFLHLVTLPWTQLHIAKLSLYTTHCMLYTVKTQWSHQSPASNVPTEFTKYQGSGSTWTIWQGTTDTNTIVHVASDNQLKSSGH